MKSEYSKPTLVEYGSMASLTQGTGNISNDLLNGNAVPGTARFTVPGSTVCDDTRIIISS